MGRVIVGPLDDILVTTDSNQNIWALTSTGVNKLRLHGFNLYSASIIAENLRLVLRREDAAAAGTAVVEAKLDEDNGTINATMITLDTTPDATPGDVLAGFQWEQLGPLIYEPIPEDMPIVQDGGIIVLTLLTALGTSTRMSGQVIWEEL